MSAPSTARDPAASMSLITELMTHPLDPAYEAAAARREREDRPRSTGLRSPMLLIVCLLVGVGLATSALTLRLPLGLAKKQHDQLVSSVQARQDTIDSDTSAINELQRQITAYQNQALKHVHRSDQSTQLSRLAVLTGAVAVKGPGLNLSIDDAKGADTDAQGNPRTDSSSDGRVTSSDMQIIVNGLWQSGAEAMAINGQRLTAETAIRFAGEAILVNFRPLSPPYTITAVGAGNEMERKFKAGTGGVYLGGLVGSYGIRSTMSTSKSVNVPAGPAPLLAYAKVSKEKK
ncbi:DUF881 domain-containing protein [Leekyejoonella antrihumi]|uniref:DUF881 domain-containing protein n=1 Tax=Leekyejoonella antrihumi TaxID=1660198 RepID=A0A563E2N1_9MICO|nr:DUF881 domain-containing protein [Leekyejoonella antrihumi]TWP36800.1 DUF881 domain-containing protein [Leekyejoonella antrihumi]